MAGPLVPPGSGNQGGGTPARHYGPSGSGPGGGTLGPPGAPPPIPPPTTPPPPGGAGGGTPPPTTQTGTGPNKKMPFWAKALLVVGGAIGAWEGAGWLGDKFDYHPIDTTLHFLRHPIDTISDNHVAEQVNGANGLISRLNALEYDSSGTLNRNDPALRALGLVPPAGQDPQRYQDTALGERYLKNKNDAKVHPEHVWEKLKKYSEDHGISPVLTPDDVLTAATKADTSVMRIAYTVETGKVQLPPGPDGKSQPYTDLDGKQVDGITGLRIIILDGSSKEKLLNGNQAQITRNGVLEVMPDGKTPKIFTLATIGKRDADGTMKVTPEGAEVISKLSDVKQVIDPDKPDSPFAKLEKVESEELKSGLRGDLGKNFLLKLTHVVNSRPGMPTAESDDIQPYDALQLQLISANTGGGGKLLNNAPVQAAVQMHTPPQRTLRDTNHKTQVRLNAVNNKRLGGRNG